MPYKPRSLRTHAHMKKIKPFVYLLGLSLAFLAGYHLNGTDKRQTLQVVYMEDMPKGTFPIEQQVLALVLSDPYHDAQMAVLAKDYRRARILGANSPPPTQAGGSQDSADQRLHPKFWP